MPAIEVYSKEGKADPAADALKQEIREDLGINTDLEIRTISRYNLEGNLGQEVLEQIGNKLLADPVEQAFSLAPYLPAGSWEIVVSLNPDVTDNVGTAAAEAIADLKGEDTEAVGKVRVDRKYLIRGEIEESEIKRICKDLLANEVIEQFSYRKSGERDSEITPSQPGESG